MAVVIWKTTAGGRAVSVEERSRSGMRGFSSRHPVLTGGVIGVDAVVLVRVEDGRLREVIQLEGGARCAVWPRACNVSLPERSRTSWTWQEPDPRIVTTLTTSHRLRSGGVYLLTMLSGESR